MVGTGTIEGQSEAGAHQSAKLLELPPPPQPTATAKATTAATAYKVKKPIERRMHPPPAQTREADFSPASAA